MELAELIAHGESEQLEFKESLASQRDAFEALVGMANTETGEGQVIFGVRRDGSVVGVEPGDLDRAQRSMVQTIRVKIEPSLEVSIRVEELDGKRLLLTRAKRARAVPYHEYGGRAFMREGTTTRQLSLEEKQRLSKRRNRAEHNGPWRCDKRGCHFDRIGSTVLTPDGPKRSYVCACGGELWPA